MNKIALIGIISILIFGCNKESIDINQSGKVEGLELSIFETNNDYNLIAVHFIDNLTGYASGNDGILIKSNDGGSTWKELETNTSVPLYGIDFINREVGFVVGGESGCHRTNCIPTGAIILKTTDGGDTWKPITLNLNNKIELKSIHFINNSVGFAIGNSSILKTVDAGNSWKQIIIENLEGTMQKIDFNGNQYGMIICNGGKIVSTNDGGNSWEINSTISVSGSVSISLTEDNIAFASGNTKIFKSTNFGSSWIELANSPTDNFDIYFITQDIGYAIGRENYSGGDFGQHFGAISYTIDGGENWIGNDNIIETGSIYDSSFPSKNQGYLVSSNKIIKVIMK